MTPTQAQERLASYGLSGTPLPNLLRVASDDLDHRHTYIGAPLALPPVQYRAFPRTVDVQDDPPGAVPGRILDWVALRAYQLGNDDDAPVTSEKVDTLQEQFSRGKRSTQERLMEHLLTEYKASGSKRFARIV